MRDLTVQTNGRGGSDEGARRAEDPGDGGFCRRLNRHRRLTQARSDRGTRGVQAQDSQHDARGAAAIGAVVRTGVIAGMAVRMMRRRRVPVYDSIPMLPSGFLCLMARAPGFAAVGSRNCGQGPDSVRANQQRYRQKPECRRSNGGGDTSCPGHLRRGYQSTSGKTTPSRSALAGKSRRSAATYVRVALRTTPGRAETRR